MTPSTGPGQHRLRADSQDGPLVVDVLVVGAGPAGLTVAAEVARAGHRVAVLEKRDVPSSLSRAFGVHARTLEAFDQRGLADELVATGVSVPVLRLLGRSGIDLSRLPSRFAGILVTPQSNVDGMLEKRAHDLGVSVVRGARVVGVEERGGEDRGVVLVDAETADGPSTWRASYVVAADGVHSTVRERLGLPFPGRSVLRSMMIGDVELADPPREVVTVDAVEDRFAFLAPFGDGRFRVIAWDRHQQADRDEPLREETLREVLRAVMGTDHGWQRATWLSRFHCDERQLADYRHGRVLFAGDAAHAHSPAGGQGMNTGIQDATNLGWKLAVVLDGADQRLLDTYTEERHPVGRLVLRTSGLMTRAMAVRRPLPRALRTALMVVLLHLPPVRRRAALTFSGIGVGYARPRGADRLVGRRAPDVALCGETGRLFEAMRSAGFVLVLARDEAHPGAGAGMALPAGLSVVRRADAGKAMLVRPDGHVAWAGSEAGSGSGSGWSDVLRGWTGVAA